MPKIIDEIFLQNYLTAKIVLQKSSILAFDRVLNIPLNLLGEKEQDINTSKLGRWF